MTSTDSSNIEKLKSANSALSSGDSEKACRYPSNQESWSLASRQAYDQIQAKRGTVPPMYRTLIASPALALHIEALSDMLWSCSLPNSVLESLFLVVSRKFQCDEQWKRHEPKALAAGVSADAIQNIKLGNIPLAPEDIRASVQLAEVLLSGRKAPTSIWNNAIRQHGDQGIAELCAFLGLASTVAMCINLQLEPD